MKETVLQTRQDNLKTFLFVVLFMVLSVFLFLGGGVTWFGQIPRFVVVFYALFGTLLILARYRTLSKNAHGLSLLMLLLPLAFIPVVQYLFEALPVQFPAWFKGFLTYGQMIAHPGYFWSRHLRLEIENSRKEQR
jgi:hypothetical protein